ncbi:uncharacterized protein LOC135358776 isoform X2 [Latimeria chalumnae]|uniref:uncharacterized protein LOC135357798 isoform X2 n=1 Tax=Latimeria chalumnae TaxID=7897 RepID=UPI00313ECD91
MVERTHKVLIIRQTPSSQVMACSLRFLDVFLNSGKGVTFKASNGKYFSSTGNGPRNPILASHTHPDNTCYFQLSRTNAGKIVLQDYCKLYLSRIHENGVDRIEAAKRNPDICSLLRHLHRRTVTPTGRGWNCWGRRFNTAGKQLSLPHPT